MSWIDAINTPECAILSLLILGCLWLRWAITGKTK